MRWEPRGESGFWRCVVKRRETQARWYRDKYDSDEDFRNREQRRAYWDASGQRLALKALKERRRKALARMAARQERHAAERESLDADTQRLVADLLSRVPRPLPFARESSQ